VAFGGGRGAGARAHQMDGSVSPQIDKETEVAGFRGRAISRVAGRAPYIEFFVEAGVDEIAVRCVASRPPGGDPEPRIIVLFTKAGSTRRALRLAVTLSSGRTSIRVVCPVTPDAAGKRRLDRFMPFVRDCALSLSPAEVRSMRFLACACVAGDPVESFRCARSVVITHDAWWDRRKFEFADFVMKAGKRCRLVL
jgi:hypothetical protein